MKKLKIRKQVLQLAAIVGTAALFLGAHTAQSQSTSPLPGFVKPVLPVMVFVLDTSGSLSACDGGTIDPTIDLPVSLICHLSSRAPSCFWGSVLPRPANPAAKKYPTGTMSAFRKSKRSSSEPS